MNAELNKQEIDYIIQLVLTRPIGEAMAMSLFLKLTGQAIAQTPPQAPS